MASNRPRVTFDSHDRRSQSASRVTGIEDQRQTLPELLNELVDVCARRTPGKIGTCACDRTADRLDQRAHNARVRPAQSNAASVSRNFERKTVCGLNHQCQGTGPESVRESQEGIRHLTRQHQSLFDGIDENGKGSCFRARFQLEDAFDRVKVKGIGAQAIEGVGGRSYDTSALDEGRGITDDMPLGRFGGYV